MGRLSTPSYNSLYSSPGRGVDELTIDFDAALVVKLERTIKEHTGLQIETDDLMLVIRKGMTKGATDALKSQIAGRIADQVADILSTSPSAKVEHIMLTGGGAHLFACELISLLLEKKIAKFASKIAVQEDPVTANVEGLQTIAQET
jgi:hypothetical protein